MSDILLYLTSFYAVIALFLKSVVISMLCIFCMISLKFGEIRVNGEKKGIIIFSVDVCYTSSKHEYSEIGIFSELLYTIRCLFWNSLGDFEYAEERIHCIEERSATGSQCKKMQCFNLYVLDIWKILPTFYIIILNLLFIIKTITKFISGSMNEI